jgi:Zn-dependent M28 family amino/carboxypeptidase
VLRDTYVVVSAHYDHVGTKAEGEGDLIWNGANDNASGVASLIGIADVLARSKPGRTVVFIAFYGEEKGMQGSRYYAANPVFPLEATVAQINIEQTGRPDDIDGPNERTLNVTGFDYSEVAGILGAAAEPLGVRVVKRERWSEMAFERSDNEALAKKGVPAHTISVAYMFPDYHKASDHWDKLDYENMSKVTEAAAAGVLAIANRAEAPRWYDDVPASAEFGKLLGRLTTRPAAPQAASAPKSGNSPATRTRQRSRPLKSRSPAAPASQSGTAPRQKSGAAPAK